MNQQILAGMELAREWRFHKGKFYERWNGHWRDWSKSDLNLCLRHNARVTRTEAAAILQDVQRNQPAREPELLAMIAWDRFTRGQPHMIIMDRVVFLDRDGNGVRNMSLEMFDRAYRKVFGDPDSPLQEGVNDAN